MDVLTGGCQLDNQQCIPHDGAVKANSNFYNWFACALQRVTGYIKARFAPRIVV